MKTIYLQLNESWSAIEVVTHIEEVCRRHGMTAELALNDTLRRARDELMSFLDANEASFCSRIPIVSYPTGDTNAWIVPSVYGDQCYVVFDTTLFTESIWGMALLTCPQT